MKKITRSGLKSVVKECLIEILTEGLSERGTSSLNESRSRKHPGKFSQTKAAEPARRRPSLDQISFEQASEQSKFDKKVSSTVSSMTDDSVLSSILEDTARTTLQEQITAESQRGMNSHAQGDKAAKAVAGADPMELFGGSSNKWAELAFATPKNRP
tara:strand:+ start:23768 stop:24238 length:471 start_codon:yes stop_codon:yes gene_type:complete